MGQIARWWRSLWEESRVEFPSPEAYAVEPAKIVWTPKEIVAYHDSAEFAKGSSWQNEMRFEYRLVGVGSFRIQAVAFRWMIEPPLIKHGGRFLDKPQPDIKRYPYKPLPAKTIRLIQDWMENVGVRIRVVDKEMFWGPGILWGPSITSYGIAFGYAPEVSRWFTINSFEQTSILLEGDKLKAPGPWYVECALIGEEARV